MMGITLNDRPGQDDELAITNTETTADVLAEVSSALIPSGARVTWLTVWRRHCKAFGTSPSPKETSSRTMSCDAFCSKVKRAR